MYALASELEAFDDKANTLVELWLSGTVDVDLLARIDKEALDVARSRFRRVLPRLDGAPRVRQGRAPRGDGARGLAGRRRGSAPPISHGPNSTTSAAVEGSVLGGAPPAGRPVPRTQSQPCSPQQRTAPVSRRAQV